MGHFDVAVRRASDGRLGCGITRISRRGTTVPNILSKHFDESRSF
jgi:hypothetical protein